MSPFPTQLTDRWANRVEPRPDEGIVYWHILLGDDPQLRSVVDSAQRRLASFEHMHMTPRRWLHITTLTVGSTDEIDEEHMQRMLAHTRQLLSGIAPIGVTVGRILYHPEAVMLRVQPEQALHPLLVAAQEATRAAIGRDGSVNGGSVGSWTPHITVCYSTAQQPADPVISALGKELPGCEVTVDALSMVIQRGAERLWDWQLVGSVSLMGDCRRT